MKNIHLKEQRRIKMIFIDHDIEIERLKKYENYLSEKNTHEQNLNELNVLISELKNEIKKIEYFDIGVVSKQYKLHKYTCEFSMYIYCIIIKIKIFLSKNEKNENYEKYLKIVFPEGHICRLHSKIEIDTDNFNKIYVGEISKLLRSVEINKKIYKSMIKKIGYISLIDKDDTKKSKLIWNNIIKDDNIYSFICDKKIISFSNKTKLEKIISTLKDFFKSEIENKPNEIIFDKKFIKKYNIEQL